MDDRRKIVLAVVVDQPVHRCRLSSPWSPNARGDGCRRARTGTDKDAGGIRTIRTYPDGGRSPRPPSPGSRRRALGTGPAGVPGTCPRCSGPGREARPGRRARLS
ncbi:hypothetical protein GCM10018781_37440 [Kitasatospora indigofera]|uniref:Uncharacterized protein n=1 Tax=Kitasatospora indigofera TaxID=67307 RepID=A0A919FWT4_9ACTN|nr:hypothetical protein GCM10018781_37440 [Kitasatospora indigofera]